MSERGVRLYAEDIREAIRRIEEYTVGVDFDDFTGDTKTIDAVVRNLTIIGEAVKNLPRKVKLEYSDIPWREITGMRNKVTHEYFGVDEGILWKTIKEDLPSFKKQISEILKSVVS